MLIVLAPFRAKRGERDRVIGMAKECVDSTRKEEGCIMYDLMASTDDFQGLSFVEKWTSKEALRKHLATPHVKKFFSERTPFIEGETDVTLFEASQESL
ncbi:MAG: antibiotic biosynthesis monooxygenase [Synergistaceae bacterium]|nr:antibiotic biosynthesis monooxygenase [Synergistaceae bacterium]